MFRAEKVESITGILKKIKYQKDNGWGVYDVTFQHDNIQEPATLKFTGVLPNAVVGQSYVFTGSFHYHDVYGTEFKFTTFAVSEKESAQGAYALLSSSCFHGIGPKRAQAIVDRFGDKSLEIIRNNPMKLTEIPGVGTKQALAIQENMPDIGAWERLRMLLKTSTDNTVSKIFEKYGEKAVQVIKENPYSLIKDIDGFGFLKADSIAASVGITGAHPLRVQAAIYHCLSQAAEMNGHCYSYADNLQVLVQELIPGVSVETIADAIKAMMSPDYGLMRLYVDDDGAIYLYRLWAAEYSASQVVREMCQRPIRPIYTMSMVETAAAEIYAESNILLEQSQKDAVLAALNTPLCVVTGGPGTGKTTIIKTMLRVLENNGMCSDDIALMAPTGRAARRMVEATQHEATTIHSALGLGRGENSPSYSRRSPFPADYIIVDECSMIDISLAYSLLRSINPQFTHLILIGDADQLPPVGPGIFMLELIKSYRVPTVRLKFSYRQSGSIAQNANKVNSGMGTHSFIQDKDFHFQNCKKEAAPAKAIEEYLNMVDKYGINDVVMLSPKKKGGCGTVELNKTIQRMVNPDDSDVFIKTGDYEIRVNDRVMLTKNSVVTNHANGDVGTVNKINENTVLITFDGSKTPTVVSKNDIKNSFLLSYVSTIHKSQGSEYAGVVMLFTTEHFFMAERALVYTGMTRAKKEFAIIGDPKSINRAVSIVKPIARNSKLCARINA